MKCSATLALLLAGTLSLTACGSGKGSGSAAGSSAAETTPAVVALAGALCDQYCDRLMEQADVCPQDTKNLVGCGQPLASGEDLITKVRDELTNADPAARVQMPDVFAAMDTASAAWDEWSARPICNLMYDTSNDQLFTLPDIGHCTSAAGNLVIWQPQVAVELRALTAQ